jgi:hypothetical protein
MNSQNERLLRYLKDNGSVTQLTAFSELGIFRLASRINDLKKKGYRIAGEMVKVSNRFGEEIRVKKYSLIF